MRRVLFRKHQKAISVGNNTGLPSSELHRPAPDEHLDKTLGYLLHHALETVPFYQRRRKQLLHSSSLPINEWLQCFPLIDRRTLRAVGPDMISSARTGSELAATSGSTGPSIYWARDPAARQARNTAIEHLHQLAAPGTVWRKSAFLVPPFPDARSRALAHSAQRGPGKKQRLFKKQKIFETSSDNLASVLSRRQPDVLIGAPRSLLAAARALNRHPPAHAQLSPSAFLSIDEPLLPPVQHTLANLVEGPVIDIYAMRETAPPIAFCLPGCSNFHADGDFTHVEILNKQQTKCAPGTHGEIVITDLTNFTAPLIRYRTGDLALASSSDCTCGLALPTPIQQIKGRTTDTILLPDNTTRQIAPLVWNLAETTGCIPSFQQTHPGKLHLTLFPLFPTSSRKRHTAAAQEILDHHLSPHIQYDISFSPLETYLFHSPEKCKFRKTH